MRVLVSGASGLIGTAVVARLRADGHTVERLVRRAPRGPHEHAWDPSAHLLDPAAVDAADAVVDLSGAPLARLPWTSAWRAELVRSRIDSTRTLVEAMTAAGRRPAVLVNASAVGFYGDRPGERLTEDAPRGTGFLADLTAAWEAAASLAPPDTRVVTVRTGIVVAPSGAMRPLALLARTGLGGLVGGGQHWPWIALDDEAAAIVHLIGSRLSGPVNLAGPVPCTAEGMLRMLAPRRRFVRPPGADAARRLLGLAGRELLLSSQKVVPARLLADGFVFRHETADAAITAAFGPRR